MEKIILASQSPRRKQLLEWAEIPFEVAVQETDESFPRHLGPAEAAMHIARNKALALRAYDPGYFNRVILSADSIVVLNNEIFGKPKNREEAIGTLKKLSGNIHQVITGVCIVKGEKENCFADITEVEFHPLSPEQIVYYVDAYNPSDKAGAYAIQEWIGVIGIKSIRGDFYNVMGLPVSRVAMALSSFT
jgi:septum formation protein